MASIRLISEEEAEGKVKELYEDKLRQSLPCPR